MTPTFAAAAALGALVLGVGAATLGLPADGVLLLLDRVPAGRR